jgi:hypothetical protein
LHEDASDSFYTNPITITVSKNLDNDQHNEDIDSSHAGYIGRAQQAQVLSSSSAPLNTNLDAGSNCSCGPLSTLSGPSGRIPNTATGSQTQFEQQLIDRIAENRRISVGLVELD